MLSIKTWRRFIFILYPPGKYTIAVTDLIINEYTIHYLLVIGIYNSIIRFIYVYLRDLNSGM